MTDHRNILFLTNSELGQASVMLAVAAEVTREPLVHVHLASFSPLASAATNSRPIKFHCIPGPSMKQVLMERGIDFLPPHAPGVRGGAQAYREALPAVLAPWDPQRYFSIYDYCCELIQKLDPAVVVLDPLLGAASDACVVHKRRRLILSPNTFKDHAIQEQPGLSPLWRFPMCASMSEGVCEWLFADDEICSLAAGYPVPLPFWAIPCNIYLFIRLLVEVYSAVSVQELTKARNKRGIPGNLSTLFTEFCHEIPYLVPSTPDMEFPMNIPTNMVGCGPIIPEIEPLDTTHPELAAWLAARPTVVINLGSHVTHAAQQAKEILRAVLIFLEQHPETQILWKLQSESALDTLTPLKSRVRIMPWLPSSPVAILTAAPSIVAYVHHGGSNSFHEAVAAGVPQIVCPVWLDTYDFATRVEYLGIGARGNSTAAPKINSEELALALGKVVAQGAVEGMRKQARKLAGAVGGVNAGRKAAAGVVLDAAVDSEKDGGNMA